MNNYPPPLGEGRERVAEAKSTKKSHSIHLTYRNLSLIIHAFALFELHTGTLEERLLWYNKGNRKAT